MVVAFSKVMVYITRGNQLDVDANAPIGRLQ